MVKCLDIIDDDQNNGMVEKSDYHEVRLLRTE